MTNNDIALLYDFARNNSESAFAEIVSRHVNLVYSVALRQVRDSHLAEEITQAVFIILARKANSISEKTILSGWLCRTARYASANALTIQRRRQQREQEAFMQSQFESEGSTTETWNQIAPLLDGAMEKLGKQDHDALVLRFFENKNFAEVGAALGASEDAAKMRVGRALEKLRKFFAKNGVSSTPAVLAGTISANSVQIAPVALAKTISAAAVTKGAAVSTTTLTLIKGALKIMAWTQMKTAVVVGVVVVLAASTTTGVVVHHQHLAKTANYAAAEDTFQTAVQAMSKGDIKTIQASYTTEFGNQFMATAGKGKSDAELAAMFQQIAGMLNGVRIISIDPKPNDELLLHIQSPRLGMASVPMKKIGDTWKINGNITTDEPKK